MSNVLTMKGGWLVDNYWYLKGLLIYFGDIGDCNDFLLIIFIFGEKFFH